MKPFRLLFVANLLFKGQTTQKICKNCKYFIGDKMECKKFSETNIITGKVSYDSAKSARENDGKCGKDAILFEENHYKIITTPYYFVKENPLNCLMFFLLFSQAGVYWYLDH
jgi:hypothetical protein